MPKISVLMPAYNAEKYITEAIESILGQTFDDFEFIIINDCSEDRTEEIVLSYDDPRIVYLKNEQNLGVAVTLNKGLALAKGEYIARMDADDISLPDRLAKQEAYLTTHDDIAVLGCGIERFNANEKLGIRRFATDAEQMAIDMLFACGLAHPSAMMRTNVVKGLGGYDEDFNGLEDYELWCRVQDKHKITTLPDVLLRYRIHSSQVTQNPSKRYLALLRALKTRQTQQLGLKPTEEFLRYCEGGKLDGLEMLTALDNFFTLIAAANDEKCIYDSEKLRSSFHSVIMGAAVKLSKIEQRELAASCHFINKHDLFVRQMKQLVKNILGRD